MPLGRDLSKLLKDIICNTHKMVSPFSSLLVIITLLAPTAWSFGFFPHRMQKPSTPSDVNIFYKNARWGGTVHAAKTTTALLAQDDKATESKAAPVVSGEELEVMLTEWDTPLVLDAYASKFG